MANINEKGLLTNDLTGLETSKVKTPEKLILDKAKTQKDFEDALNKLKTELLQGSKDAGLTSDEGNLLLNIIDDIKDGNDTIDPKNLAVLESIKNNKEVSSTLSRDFKEKLNDLYNYAKEIEGINSVYQKEVAMLIASTSSNIADILYQGQEKSSHIEYTLDGHNFVVSGVSFDISSNSGMIDALAFIASNGNVVAANALKKEFRAINLNGFDSIMAESLKNWPAAGYDKNALVKLGKQVGYKTKFDLRDDYGNMAAVFKKLGKDGIEKMYAARKTKIDIKELANAEASKESLKNITKENVFDFIVDRDNSGILDGIAKERFSEKSLLDTIMDEANHTMSGKKQILIDGPQTEQVIKGFIAHAEGRGMTGKGIIDKQFSGSYTLENFAKVVKNHPEYKVYYLNSLANFTGNKQFDLHDLVRADRYADLLKAENVKIDKNLNVINDENKAWFENQINNFADKGTQEWFKNLGTAEKASAMFALTKFVEKFSAITGLLGITASDGKPLDKDAIMANSVMRVKKFEGADGKGPRLEPMFSFKKETVYSAKTGERMKEIKLPTDFYIGFVVPLVDFEKEWRINQDKLNSASEDALLSLNSIYAGLSPRIGMYINAGSTKYFKKDMKQFINTFGDVLNITDPKLSAQLQGNFGLEKDYKSGIEYMSNKFSDRLQKLFTTNGAKTLEEIKLQFEANLKIMKSDKEIAKYEKANPGRLQSYIDMMVSVLDATGTVLMVQNNPEAAKNLDAAIMSFAKGLVVENEKEKLQQLSGTTKLTKAGIFGSVGVSFDARKLKDPNGLKEFINSNTALWGLGLNMSFSSFLIKYAPDKEKYLYMDESLKTGSDVRRIEGVTLSEGVPAIAKKLQERLNINGLLVKEDKGRLILSLDPENPVKEFNGKVVDNIATLLNIYVDPTEKNVAISPDNKQLIIGDARAFGYVNRNYFNDQSHYIIIGSGGVDGKQWIHNTKDLSTPAYKVEVIKTEVLTEKQLKINLATALNISPDDPLITGIIGNTIRINEQEKQYEYLDNGTRKKLDIEKNGITIVRGADGKQTIQILEDKKGTIEVKATNVSQPVDTKDILNDADKATYERARALIKEIKFGPLVSMYEKQDKAFETQVNAYRKTKWVDPDQKRVEFDKILNYLKTHIDNPSGIKSIDNKTPVEKEAIKERIFAVQAGLSNCEKASSCDFLMRLFDAEYANSLPNALKNGTITLDDLNSDVRITRGSEKYTPQSILDMNLQKYTEGFLGRAEATRATLRDIGFGENWTTIKNARDSIMNGIKNEKSWSIANKSTLDLVWNINMSRTIRSFSLLPVGAAYMAEVNGKVLEQKIDDKKGSIRNKLIDDLSKNNFAGYMELLQTKTKLKFDNKSMETLLKTGSVTVDGKKVTANVEAKFGFYGACLNDALMLSISGIKVEGDFEGGAMLGKLTGMDFNADGQTLTGMGAVDQVDLNVAASVGGMRKNKKTTAESNTGGTKQNDGDSGNGGSGTGGNSGGDGGSGSGNTLGT